MSGTSLLCKHLIDHLCDLHFSMTDDFKISYCVCDNYVEEVEEWLDLVLVLMDMVML